MRIAAGILMIIGAVLGITMLSAIAKSVGISLTGSIPGLLGWLVRFWAFFIGFGGYYTLKRKAWRVCLTSSILLLPFAVLPFLIWTDAVSSGEPITPFAVGITALFFVLGILPIVFVCLRKREWEG